MKNSRGLSARLYRILLKQYPPHFCAQFADEMAQVFQLACREAQRTEGRRGLFKLWVATVWDWLRSVAFEWWASIFQRRSYMDTKAFDRQLSDFVWVIVTALCAGYSIQQILEILTEHAPEPAASVCEQFLDELKSGNSFEQALEKWKKQVPSSHLARMVEIMQTQRKTGGNLANMLAPLINEIRQEVGSDGTFDTLMRELAEQVQAQLPEHLR